MVTRQTRLENRVKDMVRPQRDGKVRYHPRLARQAEKLYALGLSDHDVADILEVSPVVLSRWQHEHDEFDDAVVRGKLAAKRARRSARSGQTHNSNSEFTWGARDSSTEIPGIKLTGSPVSDHPPLRPTQTEGYDAAGSEAWQDPAAKPEAGPESKARAVQPPVTQRASKTSAVDAKPPTAQQAQKVSVHQYLPNQPVYSRVPGGSGWEIRGYCVDNGQHRPPPKDWPGQ